MAFYVVSSRLTYMYGDEPQKYQYLLLSIFSCYLIDHYFLLLKENL